MVDSERAIRGGAIRGGAIRAGGAAATPNAGAAEKAGDAVAEKAEAVPATATNKVSVRRMAIPPRTSIVKGITFGIPRSPVQRYDTPPCRCSVLHFQENQNLRLVKKTINNCR